MKGIILAGGTGSRMYPITKSISKQLLCIYDKPMVYYPLSILMIAGIRDILIISTKDDLKNYQKLFEDGSFIGLNIKYEVQNSPDGLAQAFIIGEEFIGNDDVCMVLGDNIFHGNGLHNLINNAILDLKNNNNANLFGYYVNDPKRYGVIGFDKKKNPVSIEEKPINPKSNYVVVGLYFYPNSIIDIAKKVKPSNRGELEITSINNAYMFENKLNIQLMGDGFTWLDTGTPDSLLEASNYIQAIEKRQGLKIACIEEIAFKKNYISKKQLYELVKPMIENEYGGYLNKILKNEK